MWYADGVGSITHIPTGSYDDTNGELRARAVPVVIDDRPSARAGLDYTAFAISSLVLLLAVPLGLALSTI